MPAICPTGFDGYVEGPRAKKPHHRDPAGLLRARRKRPCRRAAEQSDELAPLQLIE